MLTLIKNKTTKNMKKFIFIFLLLSFQINAYSFKEYKYEEIMDIKRESMKYIVNFCSTLNQKKFECIRLNQLKFPKYLNYYDIPTYGSKILDACLNKHILKKELNFNKFYSCMDNYDQLIRAETIDKSINHFLVIPEETESHIINFCRKKTSMFDTKNRTICLNENRKYSKIFYLKFFGGKEMIKNSNLKKCMKNNYSLNDNKLFIDFENIGKCIN